ncbi:MAG: 4Fe-4S dicluster domain-containing protein [Thermodesulfobacteriota bacterium]|nr:4Fe-4S dicluster domain-containing protein [Thermodesulfobacteriota bacterium]
MQLKRRNFFKLAAVGAATAVAAPKQAQAWQSKAPADAFGALVDISRCIGCRKCEQACNAINELPPAARPFDDLTIFEEKRRPNATKFTVVNRYNSGRIDDKGLLVADYVKVQCMHCQDPACASACITGALSKHSNGAVHYDVSKCIGCRYCMVACPFEIPAYEYHNPITPKVMKCTFCETLMREQNKPPACATICPTEAITFGKRSTLLKLAKKRLHDNPGRYVEHIYGEKEVGGTSWLYLSRVPFAKLGFLTLSDTPLPRLTETLQHSLFSFLWSPALLFTLLGGVMIHNHKTPETHSSNKQKQSGGDS